MELAESVLSQCVTSLSAGGVGGNVSECQPAGTGSWFGGGLGGGAAHCRLQDSIVIIMTSEMTFLICKLTEKKKCKLWIYCSETQSIIVYSNYAT